MTMLDGNELNQVNGGVGVSNRTFDSKQFKCLGQNCEGIVTGTTSNGVEYEGTCPVCGKLWDYNVDEAI